MKGGFICGWAGRADYKESPGTLGWELAEWFFRNPLRRMASWYGIWLAKIDWQRLMPFGLEYHKHKTRVRLGYVNLYSLAFSLSYERRILTQFGTSIDQVSGIYFHVTNVHFHAYVLNAHVTLTIQFDGIASQQPRAGHIVLNADEISFYSNWFYCDLVLTRRNIENSFAHDWDLTNFSFTFEFSVRNHFWHVKVDF